MTEFVSVLLPTHNRVALLSRALSSLRRQRGVALEILVCDDGSSDATPQLLDRIARHDPRVRWIRNEKPAGIAAALNALIAMSRARWIARMDDDDFAYPDRLALQLEYMQAHRLDVCGTWFRRVAGWRRSMARPAVEHGHIVGELLFQSPLLHPSIMMRKALFERFGPYATQAQHAEDYELWVRLLTRARFGNCPRVLMDYRLSRRQVSRRHNELQVQTARALRVRALCTLGLDHTEEEARLHAGLRDPEPITSLIELNRIHDWLLRLHAQLDPLAQRAVRRQWFLQAVRAAGLGSVTYRVYRNSPLAQASVRQRSLLHGLTALRLTYRGSVYNALEPLAPWG